MGRKDVDTIGSPVYDMAALLAGDIADGSFVQIDLDVGVYRKYVPFDFIEIYNSSAVQLELILNDVHHFPLPPNVVISKSDIQFRRFRIANNSGGASGADVLFGSIQHQPMTADKASRKGKGLMDYIPLAGFLLR